jgi:hypothetical protein
VGPWDEIAAELATLEREGLLAQPRVVDTRDYQDLSIHNTLIYKEISQT